MNSVSHAARRAQETRSGGGVMIAQALYELDLGLNRDADDAHIEERVTAERAQDLLKLPLTRNFAASHLDRHCAWLPNKRRWLGDGYAVSRGRV